MKGVLAPKVDATESPFGGRTPGRNGVRGMVFLGQALIPPTHTQHRSEREGHSGEWDVRERLV